MVLSQLSYSPEVCSDLSNAITGEPGADYGPMGLSPALLPRRVRSDAGPKAALPGFHAPRLAFGRTYYSCSQHLGL